MWRRGSKLIHPYNPELGVGVVNRIEGRYLFVYFESADQEITLAQEGSGLTRLILPPGARARILETGEEVEIARSHDHRYLLSDGREVDDSEIWPLEIHDSPIERLATFDLDPLHSFRNRVDGLRLQQLREAGGLGSFLGGRIELFPHQLHTALRAVERDPVRWLLADEVGLGKTVEACLVLSALLRTGRAERALIIAPGTLTVQWLGELYRKFHQVFVLLDHARIESVERDYGEGVNPFEVHPFGVISMGMLASDRRLSRLAAEAELDVVVVDEAHRLGEESLSGQVAELVRLSRHALLLTATPLQADRKGFYRLLALLYPESFASFENFDRAIETGEVVLACTSSVRRSDVGGLPPRRSHPIDLPAASEEVRHDPRARWIAERVRDWLTRREKALVFVKRTDTLRVLKEFLESVTRTHMAVFHEGLSAAARDIEVARFRDTNAPVLLCSEAGGEGRNFQFCDRMVHYELPSDPTLLEQRIGRLDRIGREKDVEIVYFRTADAEPDLARLYERLDLFERPTAGLDAALGGVRRALEETTTSARLDTDALIRSVEQARRDALRKLPRVFYPDAYDPSKAEDILALVPADLEAATKTFCLGAAEDLGLTVVEKGGRSLFYLEFGNTMRVETLPGVPPDSRYLGTFNREEAVEKEEMEFFASGHPLVEGLLLELEDGNRGRAALFQLENPDVRGAGLLCLYKDGANWEAAVIDADKNLRPEWSEPILSALDTARPLQHGDVSGQADWAPSVRELGELIQAQGRPGRLVAAAFFVGPS